MPLAHPCNLQLPQPSPAGFLNPRPRAYSFSFFSTCNCRELRELEPVTACTLSSACVAPGNVSNTLPCWFLNKCRKLCELVTAYVRETLKATAPHLAGTIAVYRAGYRQAVRGVGCTGWWAGTPSKDKTGLPAHSHAHIAGSLLVQHSKRSAPDDCSSCPCPCPPTPQPLGASRDRAGAAPRGPACRQAWAGWGAVPLECRQHVQGNTAWTAHTCWHRLPLCPPAPLGPAGACSGRHQCTRARC